MSDRAHAYRDPALNFGALRLAALHEGGRTEETLATGGERECLYAHLCTCTQPAKLIAAGESLKPTPIRSVNWLDGSCLAPCSMYLESSS